VNMGVLPLQFKDAETAATHKLIGREHFDIIGVGSSLAPRGDVAVRATADDGSTHELTAVARIDTPEELIAFRNGGILPYVLRQLVRR